MFPAGLYSLTPRDIVGSPLELVERVASVASVSGAGVTSTMYTVPVGRILCLTSFGLRCVPDAASLPRSGFLRIDGVTVPTPIYLAMKSSNLAVIGLAEYVFSWDGFVMAPGGSRIVMGFITATGGLSSLYDFSFTGFVFPLGTVQPNG